MAGKMKYQTVKPFICCCVICLAFSYIVYQMDLRNQHFKTPWSYELVELLRNSAKRARPNVDLLNENTVNTYILTKLLVNSSCPNLTFSQNLSVAADTWHPADTEKMALVWSAYLSNNNKEIYVIGIKSADRHISNFYCQIWAISVTGASSNMTVEKAVSKELPESHGKRYRATFFICPVGSAEVPSHVSVVTSQCQIPLHLLELKLTTPPAKFQRQFTVCLSPLRNNYSDTYGLVEWLELNRILGAEMFIVYNSSSASSITNILQSYSNRGLVQVVQWSLPPYIDSGHSENIHTFGQVAALQDCLYRNKVISEFIVNVDLDEYIIPRDKFVANWKQMLAKTDNDSCAYNIRNTFFKKEWSNNRTLFNESIVKKIQLTTLQKLEREKKIFPHNTRSKYIAKTTYVTRLMIHEVRCGRKHRTFVPPETALVHHYRNRGSTNDPPHVKFYDDTLAVKYGEQLITNVTNAWAILSSQALSKD